MGKKRSCDEWVSGKEGAEILSHNSGHTISQNYVRLLAKNGRIRYRAKDGRTNEYNKSDLLACIVVPKTRAERERVSQITDKTQKSNNEEPSLVA